MTSDDEYDGSAGLRRALSVAAGSPPGTVDPVAARRAGDARARTKTAITTSLAFSLVIFAGLGSIYFAAHRSRPSSLGSDQTISTPFSSQSASASAAPPVAAAGYTVPTTPIAGQLTELVISGSVIGPVDSIGVGWGDGTRLDDPSLGVSCNSPGGLPPTAVPMQPYARTKMHAWTQPGTYGVTLRVSPLCGPVQLASFHVTVLPAPTASLPLSLSPAPRASESANALPTAAVRASGSVKPTSTETASPTISGSASASPSPYSSPSPHSSP